MRTTNMKTVKRHRRAKMLNRCRKQNGNHFLLLPRMINGELHWLIHCWRYWYQIYDMGGYCYCTTRPKDGYGFMA